MGPFTPDGLLDGGGIEEILLAFNVGPHAGSEPPVALDCVAVVSGSVGFAPLTASLWELP